VTDAERRELIEQHREVLAGYPADHPQAEAIRQAIRRMENDEPNNRGEGPQEKTR
jgi:pyridoxal/pyridoxine/pyridoxamine kinase